MRHSDGFYYYVHTTQGWSSHQTNLQVTKSRTLSGIGAGATVTVWTPPTGTCSGNNCYTQDVWAPEIYNFNGIWYLYFSASGDDTGSNRIWVITNTSADPTTGSWSAPKKIHDTFDGWQIDQTVTTVNGQMYMAWSEFAGKDQHVVIAKMSDPTTIVPGVRGTTVFMPTLAWETSGSPVNEGPQFIVHGSKVHLTFSASGCWTDDYKLGEWTANVGADLSVASNWTKNATPFLQKGPGAFGPGHHAFVKSPDGAEDWVVYHANPASGQGCLDQRTTRIQKLTWSGDTMVVGAPTVPGTPVTRPSGEGTATILYRIRNQASGKVMSIDRGAATANGAAIWDWTNFNNTDQLWALDPTGSGFVQFTTSFNGNVADVFAGSTAAGALVKSYVANGGANQHWKLSPTDTQYFKVQNQKSGLTLDLKNGDLSDGAVIQQWTNNDLAPQRWLFERVN
jgi:GH43 family beta-xylosidase